MKPICLIILDGWGLSEHIEGNAIRLARTPHMDNYNKIYPNTRLDVSGEAVGLPEGQMGNSEVGHLNIGAGRVVYQEFTRINKEIENGDFFKNKVLIKAIKNVKKNKSSLHLMGLVSDGGVHSHINHLKALIDLANDYKVKDLFIHAFLDGRDVPPRSAIPYLKEIDYYLKKKGIGEISSVSGRYYSMDRDNRWDRVKKSYDTLVYRIGEKFKTAADIVERSYCNNIDDEFVVPSIVRSRDEEKAKIKSGDSVIFFNFRPDRARQLTRAFISDRFKGFDRGQKPPKVYFVCMTQYDKTFNAPVAFLPQKIKNTLGEVISNSNLKQLRIAETEKYAHVTFFFNGGIEKPFKREDRILISSPKVATYDLKPEMSAFEVTDAVVSKIKLKKYDVIILNYANPDMVGHTGNIDAAIKAVEAVDKCVGRVVEELITNGGLALITADHGNAEEMIDPVDNRVITAHSTSPVPFLICNSKIKLKNKNNNFKLSDIAPTILDLLKIEKPEEMTGKSLLRN
ncbi:MAG: 2,3-bisphosphoglycerate-independent phosphoglycerate mutase [Candidatus Hydromicrobium americanum]|nr:MAG: 2,3-bisphosphoglycerate-independent phosphoglycerate mutase [Candidatus Hydromicrobium americanum]